MNRFIILLIALLGIYNLSAQKPIINGLNKYSGTVGETIIISGVDFPTTNLVVHFGAGKANVISATNSEIKATVPATATYGPIIVTNTGNKLSGASSQFFTLSFGGTNFDVSALDTRIDFATNEQYTYDLCNCDFNDDGLLDVVVTSNNSTTTLIYQNTSTTTTTSFTSIPINTPRVTTNTDCADLNGDGLSDLIFTSEELGNNQIFIFQNTSSGGVISFSPITPFALPKGDDGDFRTPRRFKVADLNLDGKPELIISDTRTGDNDIFIFQNTSNGTISFNTANPFDIQATGAPRTGSIAVGDLDNDQLPDIVALPFTSPNENVYIFKNTSNSGSISFRASEEIGPLSNRRNVLIGDLNNDGFNDIITSDPGSDKVSIALNSGSIGNYIFNSSDVIRVDVDAAWGISLGDLNGDGFLDVVTASTTNQIVTLINSGESTPTFDTHSIATDFNTRNIQLADYNGDSKPDIGFTHKSETTASGFFSVITNRNCITPAISPSGLTFCTGSPFTLTATNSINATYSWSTTGDVTLQSQSGNQATFVVNSGTSATISVSLATDDGSCTTNDSETFNLTGGTPPPAPSITNSETGTICAQSTFTLSAPTGQEEYLWTLPDGTTQNGQSLTISSASSNNAGTYTLRVKPAGGCYSDPASINISVDQPPIIAIDNTGRNIFCANSSTILQVPDYTGYSYQWLLEGSPVGTDLNSYEAVTGGSYVVTITSESTGCSFTSNPIDLTTYQLPVAVQDVNAETCTNLALMFDASLSNGEPGATLAYSWDFGDGSTATGVTTTHAYASAGTFTSTLAVSYADLSSCVTSITQDIIVSSAPSNAEIIASISPDPLSTDKCPEDALTLTLPTGYQSYSWMTNGNIISTTNTADITTERGQDEVEVTLDIVTNIGCEVNNTTFLISNRENSGFEFSSPSGQIINDTIELSETATEVELEVTNGSNLEWSPSDLLSNSTGNSVTIYPNSRITVVTVTGTDEAGCSNTTDFTVISPGVIARKSFSPNGDGIGYDCWEILNSQSIEGCTVHIYDEKGSLVFQGNSPFTDDCVWNGNLDNGSSQAPAGVYYFVFKCGDSALNQTGAILLAR